MADEKLAEQVAALTKRLDELVKEFRDMKASKQQREEDKLRKKDITPPGA